MAVLHFTLKADAARKQCFVPTAKEARCLVVSVPRPRSVLASALAFVATRVKCFDNAPNYQYGETYLGAPGSVRKGSLAVRRVLTNRNPHVRRGAAVPSTSTVANQEAFPVPLS